MIKKAFISISITLLALLFIFQSNAHAQRDNITTTEITVLGNCGMCKERIEKAAYSVRGMRRADWDQQKQILELTFRNDRTDQEIIERAIAKAGHDTENFLTDENTHANLHHCCVYKRDPELLKKNILYHED